MENVLECIATQLRLSLGLFTEVVAQRGKVKEELYDARCTAQRVEACVKEYDTFSKDAFCCRKKIKNMKSNLKINNSFKFLYRKVFDNKKKNMKNSAILKIQMQDINNCSFHSQTF